MSFLSIEKSVGHGGRNNPIDVAVVQHLLKTCLTQVVTVKGRSTSLIPPRIKIDGKCTSDLIEHIQKFQIAPCGMKKPDGRVDPMGKTLKAIISQAKPFAANAKQLLFGPLPGNIGVLNKVNPHFFRRLFPKQIGNGLTTTKGEDLRGFFSLLQKDSNIQDIRWAAYMLATVYHETEFSFIPNEEKGKGAGRKYGVEIEVTDVQGYRGQKNTKYCNIYYGRGYCHLTWEDNYISIGKALGLGDELYINPSIALDNNIAYEITSYGMRNGIFTGHKLDQYINGKKCDYLNARSIINSGKGEDRKPKHKIAEYAKKIEILLRLCAR